MIIKRIQVEEGFLDGLDLSFSPGLNVLIGPRGTGKTSIIELIRFCLATPGYTERSQTIEREHALSVLGSGQVTVTLGVNNRAVVVTRTAAEDLPRASGKYERPVILSQYEIESVGLQAGSRIRLLDGFFSGNGSQPEREESLLAQIRSSTTQLQDFRREIDEVESQLQGLASLQETLEDTEKSEAEMSTSLAATAGDQQKLRDLSEATTRLAVGADVFKRALTALRQFRSRAQAVLSPPPQLEPWPPTAGPNDPLVGPRQLLAQSVADLRRALSRLDEAIKQVREQDEENGRSHVDLEEQARQLRRELEKIKAGAGALARRGTELRERIAQLNALTALRQSKQQQIAHVVSERASILDALDKLREERYRRRVALAEELSSTLAPLIEISITRAAEHSEYIAALVATLRGSGLHYNSLAPTLATQLSPRELVEAVESGELDPLFSFSGLGPDRALRLAAHLEGQPLGDILTTRVEDGVNFKLLVGTDYKPTEALSTGQRCTVVLPILLARQSGVLIVDQPEDHLDNAFVVDTLIKAIVARKNGAQLIFSTHNPNIPVLGEADRVVLLGSDGRRGFVASAAPLEDPASVEAITTVMEGGRDAFARRAKFYHRQVG